MNSRASQLCELLERARFAFPVALYPGRDPEVGEVLEVDAFDVPLDAGPAVARQLADLLWPVAFAGSTLLPGVRAEVESAAARAELPSQTVWYLPSVRTHRPA